MSAKAKGSVPLDDWKGYVPEFVATGEQGPLTVIECQRCGRSFGVHLRAFARGENALATIETRPCPYCFKVSRLPQEARPGAGEVVG